jgi:hypothetical protein
MAHDGSGGQRPARMAETFMALAREARIIPGVHHYCDEWCDMCPVRDRCLAYRCAAVYRKAQGRREGEPTFRSQSDAIAFTRVVAAAEGAATPELDALPSGTATVGLRTSDPLADTAWQYAVGVSMWLVLTPDDLRRLRHGGSPSAQEVVLWHHLRIYIRLVRALAARERRNRPGGQDEANGTAKCVLVSVQRSRKALLQLKRTPASDTVSVLLPMLDVLDRGIDDLFPGARGYIRVGLDAAAA